MLRVILGLAGCPSVWGAPVKLKELFAPMDACSHAVVWLYGQRQTVYYQRFEFYWDSPDKLVLFVLTQLPNGKHLVLADFDTDSQAQVTTKIEAFVRAASPQEKRFVNLNAIALGLLQILALELPNIVWTHFLQWFRTLLKHGFPSEQIVRIALQHLLSRLILQQKLRTVQPS